MAKIPQEEIERLKQEIDLATLVRSKGVELKPHGKDLIGHCPFHNDKTPSLIITPGKNVWHCMGACQKGGDNIAWVMKAEGVSFRHAVELLRDGHTSRIVNADKTVSKSTVHRLPPPVELNADDQTLLRQVINYYHETLKKTPAAIAYLNKRGIKNEEALNRFKLGFSDRTLGLRLPKKNRKEGADIRERLTRIGIYRESGHEHFNGSIVIPVSNGNGIISEVYGRKITPRLRAGTPLHMYLHGPHQGIWNPESLKSKEIILCESLLDALTFWVNGFRNVTTSYGVEGFTEDHLTMFLDHHINKVMIAYDRDEAGDKAAKKLAEKLINEGIDCFRIQFPHNMDVNNYACQVKPADQSLGLLIQSAVWLGDKHKAPPPPKQHAEKSESLPPQPSLFLAANLSFPEITPAKNNGGVAVKTEKAEVTEARTKVNVPTTIDGEDVKITLGDRGYRIRGLGRNLSFEIMKITIRASLQDRYHDDTLDLYNARHRTSFINTAAVELGVKPEVVKRDIGRVLLKLEELQEKRINETLEPDKKEVELSAKEKDEALALLKSPDLINHIKADFGKFGLVGEDNNAVIGYLAAVSRKLDDPLALIIQSSSSAGKSSLMDAVLAFIPDEDKIKYTSMTGQSLFYMGETELAHKTLAISEEEGAEKATYAIKILQSEKHLCIASTGKNPKTGRLETQEYQVDGPTQIMLTTTAIDVDEELQNRCLMLTVNEDRQQTQAIHRIQRLAETLEGMLLTRNRERLIQRHQNIQRLLRPFIVVNPYATELTFLDSRLRTRRDHKKYLTLIRAIALLHQYQRSLKKVNNHGQIISYIEVTPKDIEIANTLASQILGVSLDDLPPQTRRLLEFITEMVKEECAKREMEIADYRFSRRDVREFIGWSDFQVHKHLSRLAEMEYVLVHRGGRGQSFVYELLYKGEGQNGTPFLMGLIDTKNLSNNHHYGEKVEPLNTKNEPPFSPQLVPDSLPVSSKKNGETKLKSMNNKTNNNKSVKILIEAK